MKRIEIESLEFYKEKYSNLIWAMNKGWDKTILLGAKEEIMKLFEEYYCNINNLDIFSFSQLTDKDLKKVLVKKFESSASFKDEIRKRLRSQKCPYCWFRSLEEDIHIEHYLPKSKFQEYSLLWLNLFLCCIKCNTKKSAEWVSWDRQFLNPYIDDLYDKNFLKISIDTTGNKRTIKVELDETDCIANEWRLLRNHFERFDLINRIRQFLNTDITKIIDTVRRHHARWNLIIHLEMYYDDHREDFWKNAVLTVLYKYFIDNPWIIDKLLTEKE